METRVLARRAYERSRLRRGALVALVCASGVAAIASLTVGATALAWLPLTFAVAMFAEWWGQALARGARRGFVAGGLLLLLPITILRPCCKPGMVMSADGACCTMPEVCVLVGALSGLAVAALLPRGRGRRETLEAAAGMMFGVASVAVVRCAPLFLGETLGLVGGLVAGIAGTTLTRLTRAAASRRSR